MPNNTVAGAPDRIKLRTPILLRFQYDSAVAGDPDHWRITAWLEVAL